MQKLTQIPARYVGLALLCLLALTYLSLFRYDLYGIDEGAARGLLLNWSIGSQMLSPVAVLGFPDLRALLFAPLNFHWVGDLTAAKVLTMFLSFAAALFAYRWAEQKRDDESALFATSLWLIAPLTIGQVDSLGAGNFLFLCIILICWTDKHFRGTTQVISGYYFILLLLLALAVSMHPVGLGIAVALVWTWLRDHGGNSKKRNIFFLGMGVVSFFVLLSRMGWSELTLLSSPLPALSEVLAGPLLAEPSPLLAVLAGVLLIISLVSALRRKDDLLSTILAFSCIFGLLAPNDAWALIVLVTILFEGLAGLVSLNSRFGNGLAAQRGLVAVVVLVLSTGFMLMDKHRYITVHEETLNNTDKLIETVSGLVGKRDPKLLIASQWPGRTMLATRHGTLPLPPALKQDDDRMKFLRQTRGISFMLFDQRDKRNAALVRQISELSDIIKTVAVMPGGVIVEMPPADALPKKVGKTHYRAH